jgi:hypothetical protein
VTAGGDDGEPPADDGRPPPDFAAGHKDGDIGKGDDDPDLETFREVLRKSTRQAHLTQASRVAPMPLEWLWERRLPLGQLTLLAGDAGVGKSLLALDLAARVSTGARWPDEPSPQTAAPRLPSREPANVLILAAHENKKTTLRPRLERAGADLDRIFFANGVALAHPSRWLERRPMRLPDDFMSLVRVFLEMGRFQLVILDPAWAFCHRGRGRSRVAGPALFEDLCDLAVKFQLAIVGIADLARASRGQLAYRPAGSKALTAAAQAAWGIVRHPRDADRRVLLPLKMNMARPAPGLEFRIDEQGIAWEASQSLVTAEALLAAERAGGDREGAEKWIEAYLSRGARPSKEIKARAAECGISLATLRRAKEALGVRARLLYDDMGYAHWSWTLPDVLEGDAARIAPAGELKFTRLSAAG